MGLPIKTTTKHSARGKVTRVQHVASFGFDGIFDTPYDSEKHRRFVITEIRALLRPKRFDLRIPRIAKSWRDAIVGEAPLLRGFFMEEPKLRDKMLRWCDKVLERD